MNPSMDRADQLPPTVIVVHPRENRAKCSVEPLRKQAGFDFWTFPDRGRTDLSDYVRLDLGGPLLTSADLPRGLLLLDGTWRLAAKMVPSFLKHPVRSLLPWQTAYPRVSKNFPDPGDGLATVEALFAAHAQMGRTVEGLLESYRWKDEFLAKNADLLQRCGLRGLPAEEGMQEQAQPTAE